MVLLLETIELALTCGDSAILVHFGWGFGYMGGRSFSDNSYSEKFHQ
jgi:hypothetical protein